MKYAVVIICIIVWYAVWRADRLAEEKFRSNMLEIVRMQNDAVREIIKMAKDTQCLQTKN